MPPSLWEERPPEGTAPLFSQELLHQLRRLQQASPLLQGPLQAQEEQTSSSNTTNIQEEVRRQVSDFMSQQAQAMHRLQSENEALRERLQVRQSPPHERPQLVDQAPQPTLEVAGVPTSFYPGSVAAQERQSSNAPQVVEQAPQGQGLGGFERLMQQVSGLTPAGRPGPEEEAVPPAGRQVCSAAMPPTMESQCQAYVESLAGRQSCPAAPATMFPPLSGGMGATQVPASSAHLPSGMAAPQPPSQGLGPSANPDLLAGLVTGMRQLQDVLIKKEQATSSADEPETVKPGVSSLPKLKGIDPNTSPIDF